eukprot:3807647-Pleurochrysis_carterae.AAC.2
MQRVSKNGVRCAKCKRGEVSGEGDSREIGSFSLIRAFAHASMPRRVSRARQPEPMRVCMRFGARHVRVGVSVCVCMSACECADVGQRALTHARTAAWVREHARARACACSCVCVCVCVRVRVPLRACACASASSVPLRMYLFAARNIARRHEDGDHGRELAQCLIQPLTIFRRRTYA